MNIVKRPDINICRRFSDDLKDIDGVSLDTIEELAQQHNLFGTKTLKEKIYEDCIKVQKMGTTKEELADHLSAILHDKRWNGLQSTFSYDPALSQNSTISKCSKVQTLLMGDSIYSAMNNPSFSLRRS